MTAITRWAAGLTSGGCFLAAVLLLSGCQTASNDSFANIPAEAVHSGTVPVADTAPPPAAPANATAAAPAAPGSALAELEGQDSIDKIRVGDSLMITFSDLPPPPMAPIEERVREDGTIILLENQSFMAAGKTRRQLEQEIRQRYVPNYYARMTVSVRQQKDTQFYFVGGEVKNPGRQVYISRMTVTTAIKSAGDFTDYANKRKVKLTRVNGRVETINVPKALNDPKLDPEVFPGDSVHVPRTIW